MSDDQFWVNTGGLAKSATGFHDKAATVAALVNRVKDLSSDDRATIVGLDSQGKGVWKQLQDASTGLQQGLGQWGDAIHGAGDSLVTSAKVFDATEDNNKTLARSLANPDADQDHQPASEATLREGTMTPRLENKTAQLQPRLLEAREGTAEQPAERMMGERVEAKPAMMSGREVEGPLLRADGMVPAHRVDGLVSEGIVPDAMVPAHRMEALQSEGTPLMPATDRIGIMSERPGTLQAREELRPTESMPREKLLGTEPGVMGARIEDPMTPETPREYNAMTPLQPLEAPREFDAMTPQTPAMPAQPLETPRQYNEMTPATPVQPASQTMPREFHAATPATPAYRSENQLQPEQFRQATPTMPAQHTLGQSDALLMPTTPGLPGIQPDAAILPQESSPLLPETPAVPLTRPEGRISNDS